MPLGDHHATVAAFLPADARTTVNAVVPNLLPAGSVLMSREPRSREARGAPGFPSQLEIVYRGKRAREVGIGWAEEDLIFDLVYTERTKDVPAGTAQAGRLQNVLRALQYRYHGVADLAMASLVRATSGEARVDESGASSELARASVAVTFTFLNDLDANTA